MKKWYVTGCLLLTLSGCVGQEPVMIGDDTDLRMTPPRVNDQGYENGTGPCVPQPVDSRRDC
ncbi:hypothetical protein C7446_1244 [Kushneria sinocarnis]|uniref:Lipoprotein n=1 Tax=Kushneria sinocarnis TaxID=595502 RepID=A0A420WYJ8_9GAMM|nr:hypothetical protein C7446_1244 [Kushneria sinocarnis]